MTLARIPILLRLALLLASCGSALAAPFVQGAGCQALSDSCSSGGPFDGNGQVDPGEDAQLNFRLFNAGNETATNVRVVIVTAPPGVTLLGDTLSYPDIPSREEADAILTVGASFDSTLICGQALSFNIQIAWDGGSRPDRCIFQIADPCLACNVDVCDPRYRIPWNATGPYGHEMWDTVSDLDLDTIEGPFSLEDSWTGCDNWVFIVRYNAGGGYSDTTWNSSVDDMVRNAPRNTHFFFISDTASALTDVQAMKTRSDTALGRLSASDSLWWTPRLHHVTTRGRNLGNWLGTVITERAAGPGWATAFAVDGFQRFRSIGLLYYLGITSSPEMANINNDLRYHNFEKERQRLLDAEDFLEVSIWDDELIGGGQYDVTLPPREVLAKYDTVLFDLEYQCREPWNTLSCEWDYNHRLYLCDPANPANCGIEIGRWITPYGRGGRWVTDFSPSLAHLISGGDMRLSYAPGYPYYTSLKLLFSNRGKGIRPERAEFLYGGGGFNLSYNPAHPPKQVNIPGWAEKVELAAFITGHGGDSTANCAEFCNHEHRFTINGNHYWRDHPWVGVPFGCLDQLESEGARPNGFGTWQYGRGGWCTADDIKHFTVDATDVSYEGWNDLWYQAYFQGMDYAPAGGGADINLISWLIYHVKTSELDCSDGIDNDGDGFIDCDDSGCLADSACSGLDEDGDWVPDPRDNCALTYNPDQADVDADGVGDRCDLCPLVPDPDQLDADGDGVGDACEPGARDVTLLLGKTGTTAIDARWTGAVGAAGHDLYTATLAQLWADSALGHDTIVACLLPAGPAGASFEAGVGDGVSRYYLLSVLLPDTDEYGTDSNGAARPPSAADPACR